MRRRRGMMMIIGFDWLQEKHACGTTLKAGFGGELSVKAMQRRSAKRIAEREAGKAAASHQCRALQQADGWSLPVPNRGRTHERVLLRVGLLPPHPQRAIFAATGRLPAKPFHRRGGRSAAR